MASLFEDVFAVWSWPITAARFGEDVIETGLAAQRVIAARLPEIAHAAADPTAANHGELTRMVTEKVTAFSASGRSAAAASAIVQRASRGNGRALGALASGSMVWPQEWLKLAEANLAAWAALATLPTKMLAPVQRGVRANEKRLRR